MSAQNTIQQQVSELEDRAKKLRSIIELAPRAFVVELAGTPKSGKSTSVEAIRHFFKRFGFSVHVLTERAALCPIPMKGHLFFNTWCATTMLAELLENVNTNTDIIIADRGLFDSLIWFQTQAKRGELLEEELNHIEKFLLMNRWKKLFDLVVVLRADAATAIKRENAQRITQRTGSIMNESMLKTLSDSVDDAINRYKSEFNKIIRIDTDEGDVRSVNVDLVGQILDCFESFVDPEILVVPKQAMEDLLAHTPWAFVPDPESNSIREIINESGEYRKHLGLIYRMDVKSRELAESLRKKEFRRSRGHNLAGDFREINDLKANMHEVGLEPWSQTILSHCKELSE